MKTVFALGISTLTEPMALITGIVVLGAMHVGVQGVRLLVFAGYLFVISIAVWIARLRFMTSLKTNWDVSDRPKRVKMLVLLMGFSVLLFLSFLFWQNAELITFCIGLLAWLFGFSIITLKTKISGHMGVLTLALGLLASWYGNGWYTLFLLLPIVAWSRVYLKRHTMIEVVGGTLYSIVVLMLFRAWSLW